MPRVQPFPPHGGQYRTHSDGGFTIIELLVTLGIFALIAVAALGSFSALTRTVKAAREKATLSALASQYVEIVRNMPYSQVGTVHGNPAGTLPDCPTSQQPACSDAITAAIGGTTYKIFYEVTYIDDPADGTALAGADSSPADYKQVKTSVLKADTGQVTDFVTNVVPKGLEGGSNTGALLAKVINAQGQPVPGAGVHIQSPPESPSLVLDRSSDSDGNVLEVGLAPGVNAYRIVVSKPGYSSDQTYPITVDNPSPANPDATIAAGQVTQVTFAIDALSSLAVNTQDQMCAPINGVNVNISGAKLIGTLPPPGVLKFNQNFSSGPASFPDGKIVLDNLEWDTYTPVLLSGQGYMIYGTSPIQKIDVLPGTSQTYTMILGPYTENSLLVIVKDASSLAPLEGASVHLQKGGSDPQDYYGYTGGSVWVQNDWSGGSGYDSWSTSTPDVYAQADPNIYINNGSNDVELLKNGGHYLTGATSTLESATFDTGTSASNFTTIEWNPASQDPSAVLGIQLASNNDNATWDYAGPDGTANTYYTVPGTNISAAHNNSRYIRYKAFLYTSDDKKTPVLSNIKINYVSGCFTPGQYMFPGLTPAGGEAYSLIVSLPGYQTQTIGTFDISGNHIQEVLMSP